MPAGERRDRIDDQLNAQFREMRLQLASVKKSGHRFPSTVTAFPTAEIFMGREDVTDRGPRKLAVFDLGVVEKQMSMAVSCARVHHCGVVDRYVDRKAPTPCNQSGDAPCKLGRFG